tara:strand:- start:865 stop:1107 length:243 start_codon:yes stop_codon:yes gene_type:complete
MSYIIMGIDETGSEFNAGDHSFSTESDAFKALPGVKEGYPEARRIWVELLQDKDYFLSQRNDPGYYDDIDDYDVDLMYSD